MEEEYINFGDELVSKLDLLKAIGDYKAYSSTQPWSAARRGAFDSVIELALNRGILGTRKYTNPDTGESMYYATFGGDPFDINTYDKNTRRGWQDAAGFIGKLAESLPTKKSIEEKKKKEEEERIAKLPTFDSNSFLSTLYKNISDKEFGGQAFDGKTFDMNRWNTLDDVRDEKTGAVGTNKRKEALAKYLENIDRDFNAGEYNWENSPFKDADDFKSRLGEAVRALRSPELDDDTPALNKLGINYKDWFNNRTGEVYTTDEQGNPITYGTYYRGLLDLKDAKAKLAAEKQKAAQLKAYENTLFFNRVTNSKMLGQNAQALKEKYKDSNTLLLLLLNYAQNDIRTLSPDELSEIQGAYRYLAKSPIDNKLLKQLLSSSSGLYRNAAPNRFKKINGIDNLVWDSIAKQVIQINTRLQQQAVLNLPTDLFSGIKTLKDILNDYMNSTEGGFTPAELREVAALLFDLGAAVDPEGISSAGLSLVASAFRDYNRATDPEGWTWGDTGWATLDHGLGLLSLIPVAGGYIKGAWAASKLANYLPKMEKAIRYLGRAGSTYAMAANAPGALNTLNKIKNGEDLSLKDYLDLAYFFIGGLGHHQLNRGNRVERSAMKARGIETSNSLLNKAGITRTKAKTTSSTETTPTLKVQKTGEDGKVETKEIPITEKLLKALSKTKAEDLETKAKDLEIEIPEGYKILPKSTTTKTWSRENLNRYRGKAHSEIFGTQTSQKLTLRLKSDEEFEQYLSEHNNTWLKKFFNGSNRDIRRYDKYLGNNSVKSTTEQLSETPKTTETSKTNETPKTKQEPLTPDEIKLARENYKKVLNIKNNEGREYLPSKNDIGVNPDRLKQTINLKGENLNFEISNDGKLLFNGSDTGVNAFGKNGSYAMRKKVKEIVRERMKSTNNNKTHPRDFKTMVEEIKKLKKSGFLKQGGTIDKQRIQRYKEFIKK